MQAYREEILFLGGVSYSSWCVCVYMVHADAGVGGVYVLQKILRMSKQVLYVPECV